MQVPLAESLIETCIQDSVGYNNTSIWGDHLE